MSATSAIRNLVLLIAAGVGTGVGVGAMSPFDAPVAVSVFTPGPLYGPPGKGGISGAPAGAGTTGQGIIFDVPLTAITFPGPASYPCATFPFYPTDHPFYGSDAAAALDLNAVVTAFRLALGKPLTDTGTYDPLADADAQANGTIGTNPLNPYAPSTTIGGKTVLQRVKKITPGAKAAMEIIVKGCFSFNNRANDIVNLIRMQASSPFNNPSPL